MPVSYFDDSGFLIHFDARQNPELQELQLDLLKAVGSEWPPSWNAVVDQFCLIDVVERWENVQLLLFISDDTPIKPILDLLTVLAAIDEHHPHLSVQMSVIMDE